MAPGSPTSEQPYAFGLKDGAVFSFAGLYTDQGFVILTTRPNHLMEDVHTRMSVLLRPEDEGMWLNPDSEEDRLLQLLIPHPDADMKRWPVSSLVNKASNNFPEILAPVATA